MPLNQFMGNMIEVVNSGLDPLEIKMNKEKIFFQEIEYDGEYFYSKGYKIRYFPKYRKKRFEATSLMVWLSPNRRVTLAQVSGNSD